MKRNPLKTKRAAQAKAIAEMRFEASLNQKPEYRMTFGEVYMEYCEQGAEEKHIHDKETKQLMEKSS